MLSLLVIVSLSMIVTRIGAVALAATGMSRDVARFQARSAYTGVGFTTTEAEQVVNHAARRRIVMSLMLFGNAGFVTTIASLMLSLEDASGQQAVNRVAALLLGLVGLLWLARSRWFDAWLTRVLERLVRRWTGLDVHDYDALLHISDDYAVAELPTSGHSSLVGRTLAELRLRERRATVLGLHRADGSFVGAPRLETRIEDGDRLLVYGHDEALAELQDELTEAPGDVPG